MHAAAGGAEVLLCKRGEAILVLFYPTLQVWVLGPWGAVLLYQTAQALATGAPEKDAERRRRKQVEREARRRAKRELPET